MMSNHPPSPYHRMRDWFLGVLWTSTRQAFVQFGILFCAGLLPSFVGFLIFKIGYDLGVAKTNHPDMPPLDLYFMLVVVGATGFVPYLWFANRTRIIAAFNTLIEDTRNVRSAINGLRHGTGDTARHGRTLLNAALFIVLAIVMLAIVYAFTIGATGLGSSFFKAS